MFRAFTNTAKYNAKAGVCPVQTFTGMAGVANGWQRSNGPPNRDYGNCTTMLATVSFPRFQPIFNIKTIFFVPVVKYVYSQMLITSTSTQILRDIPVQRHAKCVDEEQQCYQIPNGKPRQSVRECEGQNGLLCASLLLLPHTPPPLILSEVRQTFRGAEMSGFTEAKLTSSVMEQFECVYMRMTQKQIVLYIFPYQ